MPAPGAYLPWPDYSLVEPLAEIPVYGTSPALLLDTALDHGGDFEILRSGTLEDH